MSVADAAQRSQVLDPNTSFCVGAPAGSGKTGLLVQRFLTLLEGVEHPESVVAITFTRKAAAEMRSRIYSALADAASGIAAQDDYAEHTLAIARRIASIDAQRGWSLLDNPTRLKIQTIDSFCGELARQMPVLSGIGGAIPTTDDARELYRDAVQRFLRSELERGEKAADLKALLLHLDNNWGLAEDLLASLLGRREQWQPVFGGAALGDDGRNLLLTATQGLVKERIQNLQFLLAEWLPELERLMAVRSQNLELDSSFDPGADTLEQWQSLADLLLTGTGSWRKRIDKNTGFPAGKGQAAEDKQALKALLESLQGDSASTDLLDALRELRVLPNIQGNSAKWALLAAITRLLPRLGAQLLVVFQERGEVDHPQIAMAANAAMGDDDTPSELALRLDYRIDHLLVDEFQDTSSLQFELIRRLTRGWATHNALNPRNSRTLFLVGDPMQSIYGFREANVGLFLKAREEGVGDLPLLALDLEVNFRSRYEIVEWVNQHFAHAFPEQNDAQIGAVSFRSAVAGQERPQESTLDSEGHSEPQLALFAGESAKDSELSALLDYVDLRIKASDSDTIAILGRSRNQLRPVIAGLLDRGIPVAAQDLDALASRQTIRDLFAMTCVLGDRFDAYSWLSLCRTPAIGLDDADLLIIATQAATANHLDEDIEEESWFVALSYEGRSRLRHLKDWLNWCDHYRDRLALRVWVEEAWLKLAGAAQQSLSDLSDAEEYFRCIETLEQGGGTIDQRSLRELIASLYAATNDPDARVQVMTLHKAKGLEFDCVIIPALAGNTGRNDSELLYWDEVIQPEGKSGFLLDTKPAAGSNGEGSLYDYLQYRQRIRQHLESARLLYVGCTRASKYLYLSASLNVDQNGDARPPSKGSLLAHIWPTIEASTPILVTDLGHDPAPIGGTSGCEASSTIGGYRRIASLPVIEKPTLSSPGSSIHIADNRNARAFGTAVHRCMESLIYRESLPSEIDSQMTALLTASLIEAGADSTYIEELVQEGLAHLSVSLGDNFLQWMLSPMRTDRRAEMPVTLCDSEGQAAHLIVDYCFLDEERREQWVIDYKTSRPNPDQSLEDFVQQEMHTYSAQLTAYASALATLQSHPVRTGLFFTAIGMHQECQAINPAPGVD